MADKLTFELVSPERLTMSEEVDMVTVPGSEGDLGVLAGHAPVLTTLRPGVITVQNNNRQTRLFVRGGFAEVTPRSLTILAERVTDLAELDRATLEQEIRDAEEDVADAKDEATRSACEKRLTELRAVYAAL